MPYSPLRGAEWALSRCALLCALLALLTLGACKPSGAGKDTKPPQTTQKEDQRAGEGSMSAEHQEQGKGAAASEDQEKGEGAPQTEEKPLEWDKPRFTERKEERENMVKSQIAAPARDVTDERVLEAMRQVPRHLFVPPSGQQSAYGDFPLPIGCGQTISQPYIVALMTQLLEVEPGDRVLEIGSGSGYQAAVLTELTPHVFTIEIIEELSVSAQERLEKLGYKTVKVKTGDGYFGWEEHAPFDGIIVTCAAGHVPPPLLEQLKPGGRMVIPVGGAYATQYLVVVSKDEQGKVSSSQVLGVAFVPMTGRVEGGP